MNIQPPNIHHKLDNIQHLRAIAALMVVVHHSLNQQTGIYIPICNYNAFSYGVDIFFVISGFIMFLSARNDKPQEFIRRRAIRILPMYWAATITLLLIHTKLKPWIIEPNEATIILKSIFFIPHYSATQTDKIWPYLIPGWTLNYEVFFYLIFFIGLQIRRPTLIVSTTIITLIAAGVFVQFRDPIAITYTRPILIEFLIGIWIGIAYTQNRSHSLAIWLTPVGFMGIIFTPLLNHETTETIAKIAFSGIVVIGATLSSSQPMKLAALSVIGDASYSIYLTHTIISPAIARRATLLVQGNDLMQFSIWIALNLVISVVIGVLVHFYIEKPTIRLLKGKR